MTTARSSPSWSLSLWLEWRRALIEMLLKTFEPCNGGGCKGGSVACAERPAAERDLAWPSESGLTCLSPPYLFVPLPSQRASQKQAARAN